MSLVPSLTESVAATAPGLLTGVTDWCSHPPGLRAERVGGTKNPDTARIAALAPDLVLANEEENRAPDLAALRAAGLEVMVTEVRTLEQAFAELERVLVRGCGLPRPGWLDGGRGRLGGRCPAAGGGATAVVPIWRRPWMVLGRDTFAGDLLARPHTPWPISTARPSRSPTGSTRGARPSTRRTRSQLPSDRTRAPAVRRAQRAGDPARRRRVRRVECVRWAVPHPDRRAAWPRGA